jgi:hypothetical protein
MREVFVFSTFVWILGYKSNTWCLKFKKQPYKISDCVYLSYLSKWKVFIQYWRHSWSAIYFDLNGSSRTRRIGKYWTVRLRIMCGLFIFLIYYVYLERNTVVSSHFNDWIDQFWVLHFWATKKSLCFCSSHLTTLRKSVKQCFIISTYLKEGNVIVLTINDLFRWSLMFVSSRFACRYIVLWEFSWS